MYAAAKTKPRAPELCQGLRAGMNPWVGSGPGPAVPSREGAGAASSTALARAGAAPASSSFGPCWGFPGAAALGASSPAKGSRLQEPLCVCQGGGIGGSEAEPSPLPSGIRSEFLLWGTGPVCSRFPHPGGLEKTHFPPLMCVRRAQNSPVIFYR